MRPTYPVALILLALSGVIHAAQPEIRFLSRTEAHAVLTEGAERQYYDRMEIADLRAKTGLALKGMSLASAQHDVREAYGSAVLEFGVDEQAAIRTALGNLQPLLLERAPLYARTPWCFVKVRPTIEGGMPHTRGDCVVISDREVSEITTALTRSPARAQQGVWTLLVHEQTHVLQRRRPALFTRLYTTVFGFRHVAMAPAPEWLRVHLVIDPDGPNSDWIIESGDVATRHWILPQILVENVDQPRMPADFEVIALTVVERSKRWEFVDRDRPSRFQDLMETTDFVRRFPIRDELFHPNEIAANMLAELIVGTKREHPEHELWGKVQKWTNESLR